MNMKIVKLLWRLLPMKMKLAILEEYLAETITIEEAVDMYSEEDKKVFFTEYIQNEDGVEIYETLTKYQQDVIENYLDYDPCEW